MEQFKLTLLITKLFAPPWGSKTGYMSRNSTMCTTKIIHEQVISKKRRANCLLPHVIHHQPLLTTLSLLWTLVLDIAKPQILLYNPACELTTLLPNTHVCKLRFCHQTKSSTQLLRVHRKHKNQPVLTTIISFPLHIYSCYSHS